MKKVIKQAFLSTLPVMVGYIVLGFGFGIILKTNGHSILLAFAIMGMLFVYCLKGISFDSLGSFMPALIATAAVVALHAWRKNTLLSIASGTVIYMLLVQLVF